MLVQIAKQSKKIFAARGPQNSEHEAIAAFVNRYRSTAIAFLERV